MGGNVERENEEIWEERQRGDIRRGNEAWKRGKTQFALEERERVQYQRRHLQNANALLIWSTRKESNDLYYSLHTRVRPM